MHINSVADVLFDLSCSQAYTGKQRRSLAFKLQLTPDTVLSPALLGIKTLTVADVYAQLDKSIHQQSKQQQQQHQHQIVGHKRPRAELEQPEPAAAAATQQQPDGLAQLIAYRRSKLHHASAQDLPAAAPAVASQAGQAATGPIKTQFSSPRPATQAPQPNASPKVAQPSSPKRAPAPPQKLVVIIRHADGSEVHFRMRSTQPLSEILRAYAKRKGVCEDIRFLFDGDYFNPDKSPAQLHMEDGDVIFAYPPQTGD